MCLYVLMATLPMAALRTYRDEGITVVLSQCMALGGIIGAHRPNRQAAV